MFVENVAKVDGSSLTACDFTERRPIGRYVQIHIQE